MPEPHTRHQSPCFLVIQRRKLPEFEYLNVVKVEEPERTALHKRIVGGFDQFCVKVTAEYLPGVVLPCNSVPKQCLRLLSGESVEEVARNLVVCRILINVLPPRHVIEQLLILHDRGVLLTVVVPPDHGGLVRIGVAMLPDDRVDECRPVLFPVRDFHKILVGLHIIPL